MAKATLMALLVGAVLTVPSPLIAQEWGRGPTPRSGSASTRTRTSAGLLLRARRRQCARDAAWHERQDHLDPDLRPCRSHSLPGQPLRRAFDALQLRRPRPQARGLERSDLPFRVDGSSYGHNHGAASATTAIRMLSFAAPTRTSSTGSPTSRGCVSTAAASSTTGGRRRTCAMR